MKLATWNNRRKFLNPIRPLTRDELRQHKIFCPAIAEAQNVFGLFRLLDLNYKQWRGYLDDLLNARFRETIPVLDEMNRLIINYLTMAYTIREHFEVSFQHRYRKDDQKRLEYDGFIDRLCKGSWPFAFLLDFRNYVQHRGLAVSNANCQSKGNMIRVCASVNAKQLLSESRNWKYSGLTESKGNIDLITMMKEFHVQMYQNVAVFVAKMFLPELQPAAKFYEQLTSEAKKASKDDEARMLFLKRYLEREIEGGKKNIHFEWVEVPNNLLSEVGIAFPETA